MICRLVLVTLTILACAGDATAQRHTAFDDNSDSAAVIVGGKPQVPGSLDSNGDLPDAWIREIRKCTRKDEPRIAVLGFDRNETAVSRDEAENIKFGVGNRLQKAGLVLTSGAEVTRLKDTREGTTGLPDAKALIHAAFVSDASIFFGLPDRQTDRVRFHLLAITGAGDCMAISEPIEWAISGTPSLAVVSKVMAKAVKDLVEAAPNVRLVDVVPFSAPTERCSTALADTLIYELTVEVRDPTRVLNGKTLSVTKVMARGPAEAGRVSAEGTFELDRDNRAFMRLWFEGDGRGILTSTGRVAIAIDRLCDPTMSVTQTPPAAPASSWQAGNDDLAISTYNKAIDNDPRDVSAYIARGEAYRRKGSLAEALRDFNKAIALDRNNPDAFYNRGFIYTLLNDHVRASENYDEAIRLKPGNASAWNNRCLTRAIIGRLQLAMNDCNVALRLLQLAMENPNAAQRLRPNYADALDSRGFTYLKRSRFDDAIADYNAALSIDPKNAEALYGRGRARLKLGDAVAGKSDIAAARAIRADIAEEFVHRGVQ